jgi:hypothetical protein
MRSLEFPKLFWEMVGLYINRKVASFWIPSYKIVKEISEQCISQMTILEITAQLLMEEVLLNQLSNLPTIGEFKVPKHLLFAANTTFSTQTYISKFYGHH